MATHGWRTARSFSLCHSSRKSRETRDKINVIDIRVTPSTSAKDVELLCERDQQACPGRRAIVAGENISKSEAYRIVQAMSWGTSLLAVLVGVLGVMNTMADDRVGANAGNLRLACTRLATWPDHSHGAVGVGFARLDRRSGGRPDRRLWVSRSWE